MLCATTIIVMILHDAMGLRCWKSCWLHAATVWFSLHTNLQAALDKVEGHHCCVCEAAAQDTPKATQGIVLLGAKLTAELCGRREGTHNIHATCRVTCNTGQKSTPKQSHKWESCHHWKKTAKLFLRPVFSCPNWTVWIQCQDSPITDDSATNMPPFMRITHQPILQSDFSMKISWT